MIGLEDLESYLIRTALDYEEIAARLDVPVGTVRSRLAKARELLARDLGSA